MFLAIDFWNSVQKVYYLALVVVNQLFILIRLIAMIDLLFVLIDFIWTNAIRLIQITLEYRYDTIEIDYRC